MSWQLRHEGSPQVLKDLTLQQIVDGLRDGQWETSDEVLGPGDTVWRKIENHKKLADIAEELATPPPVRHEEPSSIDMNALIDVCLVLLIFYMITTAYATLVQKSVPLPMTKADAKGIRVVRVDEVKSKMIRVQAYHDKNGKPVILVQNQTLKDVLTSDGAIDADKVRDAIRPYVKEDHKTEVLLDARDITWENTISIQDGARAAGVQTVHHLLKR
jgi:biopolymer transport protein ExbD